MEKLCSKCEINEVEYYPNEEHFDSIKHENDIVYCDECQSDFDDERVNESYSRGNISDVHGYLFDQENDEIEQEQNPDIPIQGNC